MALAMPYQIVFKHLLPMLTFNRVFSSSISKTIGRPMFADLVARFTYYLLARVTVAQGRATLFGRGWPHAVGFANPHWYGKKRWITDVREPGVTGRWLANPGTERKDDDLVLLWVHGSVAHVPLLSSSDGHQRRFLPGYGRPGARPYPDRRTRGLNERRRSRSGAR